jgi:microcystin-dependent protein
MSDPDLRIRREQLEQFLGSDFAAIRAFERLFDQIATAADPITTDDLLTTTDADRTAYPAPTTDWDTVTVSGFYRAQNMSNAPGGSTGWHYVLVQHYNDDYICQTAWNLTGSIAFMYIRIKSGGTWRAWREVIFEAPEDNTPYNRQDGGWVSAFPNTSGLISAFGGTSAPTGWLACDGSAVSRTTYSDLFSAIGTTWGVGDGSTTFNVPDLRGAFLRGSGSHGTGTMADGNAFAGPSVGAFEDDQMQGHYHDAYAHDNGAGSEWGPTATAANYRNLGDTRPNSDTVKAPKTDGTNGTPRSGDETRPFAAGILYVIKT